MKREWDDSVAITLEAYREMVGQRDKFRIEAARAKEYQLAWMRLPDRCRNGMCCTQDAEARRECGCELDEDIGGCGVEGCSNGPNCPA